MKMGVWQGCPLSPVLFNICLEKKSCVRCFRTMIPPCPSEGGRSVTSAWHCGRWSKNKVRNKGTRKTKKREGKYGKWKRNSEKVREGQKKRMNSREWERFACWFLVADTQAGSHNPDYKSIVSFLKTVASLPVKLPRTFLRPLFFLSHLRPCPPPRASFLPPSAASLPAYCPFACCTLVLR